MKSYLVLIEAEDEIEVEAESEEEAKEKAITIFEANTFHDTLRTSIMNVEDLEEEQ
jgi:hypothetical protein